MFWELLRYIVPPREEQNEITLSFGVPLTVASLSLAYMGYLARQPSTRLQRLLFFPIPFLMWIRLLLAYRWKSPDMFVFTLGKSFSCIVLAARTIEFASVDNDGIRTHEDSHSNEKPLVSTSTFVDKFIDGLIQGTGIIFSFRGIGYAKPHNSKLDIHIPKETKPLERRAFIRCTIRSFLLHMLAFDFIESCWKLYPPVKQEQSVFFSNFPSYIQLPLSGSLLIGTIVGFYCSIQSIYDLCTLFGVIILRHSPTDWPPIFDRPLRKRSLGSFWSIGWHSLGRRTFLYTGGYPIGWIVQRFGIPGDVGLVIGSFFASGIIHEFPFYWLGLPFNWRVFVFFMIQPVALFLERIWKLKTGRRVGGLPGMIWAYMFCCIGMGPQLFYSCHGRLGHTVLIHPAISPTRRILFPILSKFFLHP